MSTLSAFATAAEAEGAHLVMPAWGYGLTALIVFALLLLMVWMFRHTAQTMLTGGHGDDHGTHGGHRGPHETPAAHADAARRGGPAQGRHR